MKSQKYVLLKLCVTLVLVFGLHLLSLCYLSVSLANLTGTGLKKAFPGLPQPSTGSTHPGNEDNKAREQSVLDHSLK